MKATIKHLIKQLNQYYSFPNDYPIDEHSPVLDTWSALGNTARELFSCTLFFCNLRKNQGSWFMMLLLESLIQKLVDALIIFYPLLADIFILIGKFA